MSEQLNVSALIIDDSKQARKLLRMMFKDLAPCIYIVGEAENVLEGLNLIEQFQPDAIFLDIEMPGISGLQLAEILIEKQYKGSVVFTTAYNSYAIKAFRLSAIDYLLKPIQEDELIQAIEKIISEKQNQHNEARLILLSENLSEKNNNVLCIPNQNGFEYIPINEIEYLEADGSYVTIYCVNKKSKTVSKNLKYFETALIDFVNFIRPHRSFIVNKDFITNYIKSDGGFLILKSDVEIPIARERTQAIQEFLK
jgi:two-component system LytT family response regulator